MLSNRQWWRTNLTHYSVWFGLVALIIFVPYVLSGTSLVWQSDGITQHMTALAQWQQDLKHLFGTGEWPAQWSWQIGLGADYYQTFSYYTLGDIFSYGVGLFGAKHLLAYYEIMLLVRLFLAGASVLWAIKYFTKSDNTRINTIASLAYVFTGYTAFSAFEHPFFINPLIILPLLVVSFDYLLTKKHMVPFTIMVFWTLWNNYYFAFMLFLGLFIYWLVQTTITRQWLDWQRHIRMLVAGLVGALTAMILFLPNVMGVLASSRSGAPLANGLIVYPAYYYLALPGTLLVNASTPNFWLTGGLATVFILALIFILRHWRDYKVLATVFVIAGIGLFIPAFAAMFNGASSPSNRWTFMLALPLALATVYFLSNLDKLMRKDWVWFSLVGVVMFVSLYVTSGFKLTGSFGLFIALYVLTLFVINRVQTPPKMKFWLGLTLVTVLNVVLLMAHTHQTDFDPDDTTMLSRDTVQTLLSEQANYPTEDSSTSASLQRSLIANPLSNAMGIAPGNNLGMLSPAHSIDSYWSYQNGATHQFMKDLGILTSTNNNVTNDLNNRSIVSHILGVKHVFQSPKQVPMANYETQSTINHQRFGQTTAAYPLAYIAPNVVSEKTFQQATPSQREALLVDSVVTNATPQTNSDFISKLVPTQIHKRKAGKSDDMLSYRFKTAPNDNETRLYLDATPALQGTELHLELTNIKFKPYTLAEQYELDFATYQEDHEQLEEKSDSPNRLYNPEAFKMQWYKNHLGKTGSNMGGYSISMSYNGQKQKFSQTSQKNLSFYNPRSSATINLGPATQVNQMQSIDLKFSQAGTYSFDVAIVGVPTDKRFTDQAKHIQQNAVPLELQKDTITGQFTAPKSEIITTSIPFSRGWTSETNDIIKVNDGFIGIKTTPGKNDINLRYSTPGLQLGLLLSLVGFIAFFILVISHYFFKKADEKFQ